MFEGMAPDTRPQTILDGLKYKHSLELEERRDQAQTLIGSLIAVTNGGEYLDIVGHLYPPGFKEEQQKAKEEAEALNRSLSILDRFRSIGERLEDE